MDVASACEGCLYGDEMFAVKSSEGSSCGNDHLSDVASYTPYWREEIRLSIHSVTMGARFSNGSLARHIARLTCTVGQTSHRPRSLFPLPPPLHIVPPFSIRVLTRPGDVSEEEWATIMDFAIMSVASLNGLHGDDSDRPLRRPTAPQREALKSILDKPLHMWKNLVKLQVRPSSQLGAIWCGHSDPAVSPLVASKMDTPISAAGCVTRYTVCQKPGSQLY